MSAGISASMLDRQSSENSGSATMRAAKQTNPTNVQNTTDGGTLTADVSDQSCDHLRATKRGLRHSQPGTRVQLPRTG